MGETEEPRSLRDTLMLRVRATGVVGVDPDFVAELRRHRELHGERLAEYREFQRRDTARGRGTERDRVQGLVLRGGVELETFWVNWLDRAIAELEETKGPSGGTSPS